MPFEGTHFIVVIVFCIHKVNYKLIPIKAINKVVIEIIVDIVDFVFLYFVVIIEIIIEVVIEVVELSVDIGFGKVVCIDNLLNSSVSLDKLKLLRTANAAAERKHAALFGVFAGRGMSYSQRTIDAMAILHLEFRITPMIVAVVAHVVSSEATEEGSRTAVHALPIDLSIAVLVAIRCSSTYFFQKTFLAMEILLRGLALVRISHLLFAVNQATKVRLFTFIALIKGAAMVGELLWLSIVVVANCGKPFICKNALFLSILKSELLYTFFEAD